MLICEPFSADKQAEVDTFQCGTEPWALEVTTFIKGSDGPSQALTMLKNGRANIWLYKQRTGELVGFAALSKLDWEIDGKKHKVTSLHAFGVHSDFHRFPDGPREERYSSLMLSDLYEKAKGYKRPIWGLLVHKQNDKAKAFYEKAGFCKIEEIRNTHDRMFMQIPLEA